MKAIISMMLFVLFSPSLINVANGETIYFKEQPFVLITTIGQKIYIKKAEIQADNKLLFLTVDGQKGRIDYQYVQNFKDIPGKLNKQRADEKQRVIETPAYEVFHSQSQPAQPVNNIYNSSDKTQHVSGYTRKDGTYVHSYNRKPSR